MNTKIKFFILGFITACVVGVGSIAAFLYLGTSDIRIFHDQVIPSGKTVKVTSFHLVRGIEHDDRDTGKDCFALEYVSSMPDADQQAKDQETLEVFELIRPVSELWGFDKADVAAFPTVKRKGKYDIYYFKRDPDGKWVFHRQEAKVFISD